MSPFELECRTGRLEAKLLRVVVRKVREDGSAGVRSVHLSSEQKAASTSAAAASNSHNKSTTCTASEERVSDRFARFGFKCLQVDAAEYRMFCSVLCDRFTPRSKETRLAFMFVLCRTLALCPSTLKDQALSLSESASSFPHLKRASATKGPPKTSRRVEAACQGRRGRRQHQKANGKNGKKRTRDQEQEWILSSTSALAVNAKRLQSRLESRLRTAFFLPTKGHQLNPTSRGSPCHCRRGRDLRSCDHSEESEGDTS